LDNTVSQRTRISNALSHYQSYVRNPWWEVVDQAIGDKSENKKKKSKRLATTLRELVNTSWRMLSAALKLEERQLADILTAEYMGWCVICRY